MGTDSPWTAPLRRVICMCLLVVILAISPSSVYAWPGGIGFDQDNKGDVAISGCTCHNLDPSDSVTIILDEVPTTYTAGETYEMMIQIIGGAEYHAGGTDYSAGFSMRVSEGILGAGEGSENHVTASPETFNGPASDDQQTLTHTEAGANLESRTWNIVWTAPDTESGPVTFWLVGNSVNGDGVPGPQDMWNRLSAVIIEGEDDGNRRTIFSGDGNIEPPAPPSSGHTDLHHMGAKFRAHWLGLLGFLSVILVLIFCGFFLRYGFSSHYKGRSNLLRLRIKHLRRGDQL
ncbi:MAG: hypothetical protein QGH13_01320 [Candidatus Thalassarchaeaceae archaeon]|nr:hypothetical protein [Candidatus Thalassarchaeaceae archaeon]